MSHYESYVTRIADGEPAVMNAEPETMLAATSGTSGKRNILPNTQTMSSTFFANGILVIFDTLRQACPECFTLQKTCKLAFAPNWTTSAGGLRIGPNSSGPKDKSFRRLLPLYSTPAEGYEISDDEYAALYVHALFAARDAHLGIIEANFISLPARMLSLLHRDGAAIADDLERGRVGDDVAARLPAHTVEALNSHLGGPNPVRAMEVRNALAGPATSSVDGAHAAEAPAEGDGRRHGLARRLWPQLKLFLANGTGAFASYASRLQDAEGAGVPILSTVLAASEGLMGVSLDPSLDGSASYCLVPRAMFFEFLPVAPPVDASSISSGAPAGAMAATASTAAMVPTVAAATMGDGRYGGTVLAHETIVGEDYELVITNLGGLCRYRVGDVVRVVGHHHGAPLVDFRYRIGQILNLRGEKLSEPQLEGALRMALPAGLVHEYAVTEIIETEPPCYRVYVEASPDAIAAVSASEAAKRLDAAICDESAVYRTWRGKRAIGECEVRPVASGAFEALRAVRLAEGASPQQLKVSRLVRQEHHAALLEQKSILAFKNA